MAAGLHRESANVVRSRLLSADLAVLMAVQLAKIRNGRLRRPRPAHGRAIVVSVGPI
jgi:hypothetical protein